MTNPRMHNVAPNTWAVYIGERMVGHVVTRLGFDRRTIYEAHDMRGQVVRIGRIDECIQALVDRVSLHSEGVTTW